MISEAYGSLLNTKRKTRRRNNSKRWFIDLIFIVFINYFIAILFMRLDITVDNLRLLRDYSQHRSEIEMCKWISEGYIGYASGRGQESTGVHFVSAYYHQKGSVSAHIRGLDGVENTPMRYDEHKEFSNIRGFNKFLKKKHVVMQKKIPLELILEFVKADILHP